MDSNTVGVDAGGSLIKIAYEEKGRHHFRKYPIEEMEGALSWLKMIAGNRRIVLTGGKTGLIKSGYFPDAGVIDEFTAVCEGAKYLLRQVKMDAGNKFLIVNIGTGTSWFSVEDGKYERVLGSGVGGGTFMGLGYLLTGSREYTELVERSTRGVRGNVDLLVGDIYHPQEPPIPGELTASNFAKAVSSNESSEDDKMASVMNMISETITILTAQAAALHTTNRIVFIGSTLAGNAPLQASLREFSLMSGLEPVFIPNGEYSGAVGAMLD